VKQSTCKTIKYLNHAMAALEKTDRQFI